MKSIGYTISGTGETVLLLHSSMSSKGQWKDLVLQLEKQFQVIAIDLFGYGNGPSVDNPAIFSLKDETTHIDQILATRLPKDEPVHIIGHSYGGATALKWVYDHKERTKSLCLFEPVAFHLLDKKSPAFNEIRKVISQISEYLTKDDERSASQYFIDYWSGEGAFQSFPSTIQENFISQIQKVFLDFQALMGEPLRLEDYASLVCPLTLIMGTRSPISSRTVAQSLKNRLLHISFHEVDCGHMGPITHPHLVNPIFLEALEGITK